MKTFLMLHGINHNMFGKRDPKQYGTITLAQIDSAAKDARQGTGRQGRDASRPTVEGEMCERIHRATRTRWTACC